MYKRVAAEVENRLHEIVALISDTIRSRTDTTFRKATGYDYDPRLVVPSPEYLQRCEDAEPGSALRIMDEWAAEQDERRQQERDALRRYERRCWFKLWAAFLAAMTMLIVPVLLIETGRLEIGAAMLLFSAATLTGYFIRRMRRSEDQIATVSDDDT